MDVSPPPWARLVLPSCFSIFVEEKREKIKQKR
jgi:hypothetical protein